MSDVKKVADNPVKGNPPVVAPLSEDDYDYDGIALDQPYLDSVAPVVTHIPVRKPAKHWFNRSRFGEGWEPRAVPIIELEGSPEVYFVHTAVAPHLATFAKRKVLYFCVNRQNEPFFWPITPLEDVTSGGMGKWLQSAHEAARRARHEWVQVIANQRMQRYDHNVAAAELPEPVWPDLANFKEALILAAAGNFIQSLDHPVAKQLRGAA